MLTLPDENPPVELILCASKSDTLAKYALRLSELHKERGISQAELAELLKKQICPRNG